MARPSPVAVIVVVVVAFTLTLSLARAVPPAPAPAPPAQLSRAPSQAAGANLLVNPGFDGESLRPWSVMFDSARFGSAARADGELCLEMAQPSLDRVDVVLRQSPLAIRRAPSTSSASARTPPRRRALRARLGKMGAPDTRDTGRRRRPPTATAATFTATFDATADDESAELAIELGGDRWAAAPLTVCLDDVELNDPQFEAPRRARRARAPPRCASTRSATCPASPRSRPSRPRRRRPLDWQLVDDGGRVRASGKTRPFGDDQLVGRARCSRSTSRRSPPPGKGYQAAGRRSDESVPFEIGAGRLPAHEVRRAGVLLSAAQRHPDQDAVRRHRRPTSARPDTSATRASPARRRAQCNYSLDVSGGWYDAGDHGKYVVNGGFTVWMLQNQYETLSRFGTTARRLRRREDEHPRAQERPARPARRGALRPGVHAAHAGAGGAAASPGWRTRRSTARSGPPIPTSPDQDDIKRLPAAGQHGGDAEPGGGGGAGGAPLARRWIPPSRRAA